MVTFFDSATGKVLAEAEADAGCFARARKLAYDNQASVIVEIAESHEDKTYYRVYPSGAVERVTTGYWAM